MWKQGGQWTPFNHRRFVACFQQLVRLRGLIWNRYLGHSFRRGEATDVFRIKGAHDQIQLHGDWVSTAYLRYNEHGDEYRLQLPSQMAQAVGQRTARTT